MNCVKELLFLSINSEEIPTVNAGGVSGKIALLVRKKLGNGLFRFRLYFKFPSPQLIIF